MFNSMAMEELPPQDAPPPAQPPPLPSAPVPPEQRLAVDPPYISYADKIFHQYQTIATKGEILFFELLRTLVYKKSFCAKFEDGR